MLLLALALQVAPALPHPWGRFSRSPALAGTTEVVEIETDGAGDDGLRFTLRLVRRRLQAPDEVRWTTSEACPAVRAVLAAAAALPAPTLAPPGFGHDPTVLILDGMGYAVQMPAAVGTGTGTVTITSNIGTPLARWVDNALARLQPCWSATVPARILDSAPNRR